MTPHINSKNSQHYDPNRLLDTLMTQLGLNNDKALSRRLNMGRQLIAGIRAGCMPVRASMLVWIADSTGNSLDELRRILGDRRAKARMPHLIAGN